MTTSREVTVPLDLDVPYPSPDRDHARGVMIDGKPWFLLTDLCRVLKVRNTTQVASRLDPDEHMYRVVQTAGGPQNLLLVAEFGVYELMMTSRSPEARRFRQWAKQVFRDINRKGAYLTDRITKETNESQDAIAYRVDSALYEMSQAHIAVSKINDPQARIAAQSLVSGVLHLAKVRRAQAPLLALTGHPMKQLGAGVADTIRSPEIRKAIGVPTLEQVRAQALAAYADDPDDVDNG